jgi:hypothetical protein
MKVTSASLLLGLGMLSSAPVSLVQAQNSDGLYLDRFNYDGTVDRGDGFMDYGQKDWGDIRCDESSRETLDECLGYRDKWHTGREWEFEKNYCIWCPASGGTDNCGRHHQSPINLDRDRGIEGHPNAKECIDVHWMKYEDSYCDLAQLKAADAFTIERHALRITQPITVEDNDDLVMECNKPGVGRKFGRIDFSKGFSQWWFLSHIDLHTPSEHAQEGKRYDAEMQIHHFYSVSAFDAGGVANELGTVSIFLEAYEDAAPYRYLDKVICLWRRKEHLTRQECGLDPVETDYPGCFPLGARNLRDETPTTPKPKKSPFQTVQDLVYYHDKHRGKNTTKLPELIMDDVNWSPPEDKDWEAYIQQESDKLKAEDKVWAAIHAESETHDEAHAKFRNLLEGQELEWFNYFPMLGVRTEYYYRYSGSQTTPPCYGNFQDDTRSETNHWRVMKDPIRIHPRQLEEIRRLLAERIAPLDSEVLACKGDTAAGVTPDGEVSTARDLQYHHPAHFEVFCECKDWPSKWPEDRDWCDIEDVLERFYSTPYNFMTDGF